MAVAAGTLATVVTLDGSGNYASPLTGAAAGYIGARSGDANNATDTQSPSVGNAGALSDPSGITLDDGGTLAAGPKEALLARNYRALAVKNASSEVGNFGTASGNQYGVAINVGGAATGDSPNFASPVIGDGSLASGAGAAGIGGAGYFTITNAHALAGVDHGGMGANAARSAPANSDLMVSRWYGWGGPGITIADAAGPVFSGSYAGTVVISDPATEASTIFTASASVSANYGAGVLGTDAAPWMVTNFGVVSATGWGAAGVALGDGGTVVNYGLINGSRYGVVIGNAADRIFDIGWFPGGGVAVPLAERGSVGTGVVGLPIWRNYNGALDNAPGTVINYGTIEANAYGVAVSIDGGVLKNGNASDTTALITGGSGFYANGVAAVTNYGTIAGTGAYGFGVNLQAGGNVVNRGGGLITGGATGIALYGDAGSATIINYGLISGGVGISDNGGYAEADTIVNAGTIASSSGSGGTAISLGGDDLVVLEAGSVLVGGIAGFREADTIDLYDQAATNLVYADGRLTVFDNGSVVTSFALSGPFDPSTLVLGSDGGGGTDITIAQPEGPVFSGSYAHTVVIANPATEAATNFTAGASVSASYGPGILGIGAVPWMVTNAGSVTATGANAAGAELTSGGTVVNTGEIAGAGYGVLIGAAPGSVTNYGVITTVPTIGKYQNYAYQASGIGVSLRDGGSVDNGGGGAIAALISGYYVAVDIAGAAGTVTNLGTLDATGQFASVGVRLDEGGAVVNSGSAALISGASFGVEVSGGLGTLTNSGAIVGNYAGVYLQGGSLTNQAGGLIAGNYAGVLIGGGSARLVNSGTITAAYGIGVQLSAGGTVVNRGLIAGAGNGTAIYQQTGAGSAYYMSYASGRSGVGVELDAAGSLVNSGTISGVGPTTTQTVTYYGYVTSTSSAPSGIGVYLTAGGSVTNAAGGLIEGDAVGISIAGGSGTLINDGTISGGSGTAVQFAGSGNLVVIDPGAVFEGIVDGGTGEDTLELGSGGGIGTLSGLGSQYFGFSDVSVDAGARWVLHGASTIDAGVTLDDRGALTIAGGLANSGTLWADGGDVTVDGAATGGGSAEISGAATLDFAARSDAAVSFDAGASGTLKLGRSADFSGAIAGFGAGDALDLGDIVFGGADTLGYRANAAGTGGTLTLSDGTHWASLALLGQYAAAGFAIGADANGGMLVTYTPPSGSGTDQALLANPQH